MKKNLIISIFQSIFISKLELNTWHVILTLPLLLDINLSHDCLDTTPKVQVTKGKIDTWDYTEFKSAGTAKETVNKMKRQLMKWEKIFANHIGNKGLVFKIYKELVQLNRKNNLILKWAEDLNRHFPKENIQMASKYVKRYQHH